MHRGRPFGGALVLCAGGPSRCARRTIEDERISARQAQHRSREWDSSPAVGRWTGLVASSHSISNPRPAALTRKGQARDCISDLGLLLWSCRESKPTPYKAICLLK